MRKGTGLGRFFFMPRLTHATYCHQRQMLRRVWDERSELYGRLSSREQQALHRFFIPTIEASDAELRKHRKDVTAENPSLPHRAGRAYSRMERGEQSPQMRQPVRKGRHIYVEPVLRPEPDLRLLSKAVIMIELRRVREESAARAT